jgi:hypothetical protein
MVSLSLLRCQRINCLVAYFLLDLMKDLVLAGISQLNIARSPHRNPPLTSFPGCGDMKLSINNVDRIQIL